jgi:RNA-binding protein 5/10
LDTAICQSGKQRKNAVGSATSGSSNSGETAEQSKYRDRAAERREAFNQPDKPVSDRNAGVSSFKRKFAEAPKPPPPPAAPGVEPGKDEANKGNLLLAKMGWKSGTGLGKEGEGRVDPVMVQQFESRAGLGASKGVEAGKWQGEGGFKKRAMDMVGHRCTPRNVVRYPNAFRPSRGITNRDEAIFSCPGGRSCQDDTTS